MTSVKERSTLRSRSSLFVDMVAVIEGVSGVCGSGGVVLSEGGAGGQSELWSGRVIL